MKICTSFLFLLVFLFPASAQNVSEFIITDQFGYLPEAEKFAVIKDPQSGFDSEKSYVPGAEYAVVKANSGEIIFTGSPLSWKDGQTDPSSGDKVWHFDFSSVTETGSYYIFDIERNTRSYEFIIAPNVYNEVLKHAVRTFFYQRAGFAKEVQYAGEAWADGASHIGPLQDKNCRSFFDKNNPETERDVSGGWYDAGDYNKYTNWTANYVVEMMKAYMEKPDAWGDNYDIPESGNDIPDLLDEAKWGIDHLLRMQEPEGAVLSIVGEGHASPPSATTAPAYYGPPNTSATLNTAAAFALSAKVYRSIGMDNYADTLIARALLAWEWAENYPDSLFNNNDPAYNSQGLGAGKQEVNDYQREMIKLEASCYLLEATSNPQFREFFDLHYQNSHLFQWTFAYPFETDNQEVLLYYTTLEEGTASVKSEIMAKYRHAILNNEDNMPAHTNKRDPYFAHLKDYTWGSNGVKSSQGNMFYDIISYNIDNSYNTKARQAALKYINYIHGVNPLNFVYLSNMYSYGAENGVNEFYHSWFTNNSPLWDRVGESTYGPAPGFLTGGPNPFYDVDGCCPNSCGSANNSLCNSESLSPPKDQPRQKSYKDFNTSWPLNSWSVTENSCGYQVNYIRLLSKFVTASVDCNGDVDGTAFIDSCGICAGGNTGISPSTDKTNCSPGFDCNGVLNGTAFIDSCGQCAGGNTGIEPILEKNNCPVYDCNGELDGTAFIDSCGTCAGGTTGVDPVLDTLYCTTWYDCNGDLHGSAFEDSCGICAGGNTGVDPILDKDNCPVYDCNGEPDGAAFIDSCGTCAGGTTGTDPVLDTLYCTEWYDCNGDLHGSAFEDSCGICAGGNTGYTPVLDPSLCENSSFSGHQQQAFRIYPNPANEKVVIEIPLDGKCNLKLISLNGKILLEERIEGNTEIDISPIEKGVYEVVLLYSGCLFRKRIVKM